MINQNNPLITVVVIAYNHEKYISQALESIFSQKANFGIKVIVFDDFSPDNTRAIIEQYVSKYPNTIETVFPDHNTYTQGWKITHKLIDMCETKYLAILEGDDLWNDENKLQTQVEFLEKNEEYVIAAHDITSIDENNAVIQETFLPEYYRKDFNEEDLQKCWGGIMVQSAVFRNVVRDIPDEFHKCFSGDLFLVALYGNFGKSKFLTTVNPSLYRQHSAGIFTSLKKDEQDDIAVLNYYWLYRYFKRISKIELAEFYKKRIGQKLGFTDTPNGTF